MKANINYVTWYSIKVFFVQSSILVWGIIEFYIKWLSNQIISGTGFRTVVHLLYSNIFIDSKPLKCCIYNNEACFESRFLVIDITISYKCYGTSCFDFCMAMPLLYDHSILSWILLAKWLQQLLFIQHISITRSHCKSKSTHRHESQVDISTLLLSDYLIDSKVYYTALSFHQDTGFLKDFPGELMAIWEYTFPWISVWELLKVTRQRRQGGQI